MQRRCRTCKYWKIDKYDMPGEGTWFTERCSRKVFLKRLCRKYVKKQTGQKGKLFHKLEKGNGITLFGTSVMLVTFLFFYLLVQVFVINHRSSSVQLAVDNVSDSVAVYMATEGEDYEDAANKASEVVSAIRDKTGVDIGSVLVDASDLEDNIVTVCVLSSAFPHFQLI